MVARVHQFMCLKDNFGVLVHDPETRRTASIDAPDAKAILEALDERDWKLSDILVTHHHADHTQGIADLKAAFPAARVTGPAKEAGSPRRGSAAATSATPSSQTAALKPKVMGAACWP